MCGRRLTVLIWLAAVRACRAVMFESTSNATYNTAAPGGALLNSGWQYQGRWGAYLGTPIAPRFFLSAKHVGGSTNQPFWLDGVPFHPVLPAGTGPLSKGECS